MHGHLTSHKRKGCLVREMGDAEADADRQILRVESAGLAHGTEATHDLALSAFARE